MMYASPGLIGGIDTGRQAAHAAACSLCQAHGRKEGARVMMTLKQKLKVHAEIERQNRAKLDAWRRAQRKAGAGK